MTALLIIGAIFFLALLILAHEFGHFIVAKLSGAVVEEFGIGFPPRIFGVKKGETIYSLNWIPFGGFVKILGEDDTDKRPGSFSSRPIYLRAAILFAGVFFNFILGWLLLSAVYFIGAPSPVEAGTAGSHVTVLEAQVGTPAEKAGLMPGDRLVKLSFYGDSREVIETTEAANIEAVQDFINKYKGQEITIEYLRGKESISVNAVPDPDPPEGVGSLGIAMSNIGIVSLPLHKAVWEGLKDSAFLLLLIVKTFWQLIVGLFTGANQLAGQVMGPVGIVTMAGTISQFGLVYVLQFVALLSIHLVILNLIPFPALDGGRLLFIFIEAIKGSPVNQKITRFLNTAGFLLLIVLMIFITYRDVARLFK
jgi:regulator of sigma E protease